MHRRRDGALAIAAAVVIAGILLVLIAQRPVMSAKSSQYAPLAEWEFSPVTTDTVRSPDLAEVEPTAEPTPEPSMTESPIYETDVRPAAPSSRPEVVQPQPKAVVTPKATPKPVVRSRSRVVGVATWYCWPSYPSRCTKGFPAGGAYGAAGPELRAALGKWRGKTVYVNGVAVKLIDWCACGGNHVIDVYHATWVKIPHPSNVTIRW